MEPWFFTSHFVYITVNGIELVVRYIGISAHENFGISETYDLNAGDYLEFREEVVVMYSILDWGGILIR